MKRYLIFLLFSILLFSEEEPQFFPSNPHLKAKFARLDPSSLSQNLAFYELYPETKEGQLAYLRIQQFLKPKDALPSFFKLDIDSIISFVNRTPDQTIDLNEENLLLIESLGANLPNRRLKGHSLWKEEEILLLPSEEIDLCRSLFLATCGEDIKKARTYEAMVDLMALQILLKLPEHASPLEKIYAINHFIFYEMGFRFPPHSLWAKDIDIYTFLPSVIDSRKGVCLGVSILYLCLSQRLNLPLEIITPPGHIYVRYPQDNDPLNIETTARGIHIPSERYLGIETRKLQERNIKEVVGLAFINQASVSWIKEDYATAVTLYEKARKYLPEDPLLKELLGFNYLFLGETEKGEELLHSIENVVSDHMVTKNNIVEDYFLKRTDSESIKALFLPVDETKESILKKQKKLEEVIKKFPYFRAAIMQLAGTYLQLSRVKEALPILHRGYEIDAEDPTLHYYLSAIYLERIDYNKAWHHLLCAENIVSQKNHHPKILKELRNELSLICPRIGVSKIPEFR